MLIKLAANTPTQILGWNERRKRLTIQFQAAGVDTNNTGKVYIGTGFQPIATVGGNSQGEILLQSSGINEPSTGDKLADKYKKSIWVVADTADQTIVVEEEVTEI